jgi:hypothetical protein
MVARIAAIIASPEKVNDIRIYFNKLFNLFLLLGCDK